MHVIRPYIDPDGGTQGFEALTPAGGMFYRSVSFNDLLQNMHNAGLRQAMFLDNGNPYIISFSPASAGLSL